MALTVKQKLLVSSFNNKEWYPPNKLVKVTTNGEISWCPDNKEFVVFEETYSYEVGRTCYPMVAIAMLESYCNYYLG